MGTINRLIAVRLREIDPQSSRYARIYRVWAQAGQTHTRLDPYPYGVAPGRTKQTE